MGNNANSAVNPKMLVWARERNGLSIQELAKKMRRKPEEVQKWEKGNKAPSYTCLEELAYRHLKIPLAVFFFPEPPSIDDPKTQFRRLPEHEFARLSADTLQCMRLAQAYQVSLAELFGNTPPEKQIHKILKREPLVPVDLARKARGLLEITINKQLGFQSSERAFKAWRHLLETFGVFTFKDSLEDKFISGFCILDDKYPVVFINNSNAFTRQLFTLAHELGHILFRVNGVTDADETYIKFMDAENRSIEVACNEFAAELLLPSDAFEREIVHFREKGPAIISDLALKYSVSREVVLRRLYDLGLVSADYYQDKAREWNQDYLRVHVTKGGGNFYLTKLSYLGEGFTKLAFEKYHQGQLSKTRLASHLNVNSLHIDKFERYLN
jgi:Zn-dependent peptidase ImmA (M78 family)